MVRIPFNSTLLKTWKLGLCLTLYVLLSVCHVFKYPMIFVLYIKLLDWAYQIWAENILFQASFLPALRIQLNNKFLNMNWWSKYYNKTVLDLHFSMNFSSVFPRTWVPLLLIHPLFHRWSKGSPSYPSLHENNLSHFQVSLGCISNSCSTSRHYKFVKKNLLCYLF